MRIVELKCCDDHNDIDKGVFPEISSTRTSSTPRWVDEGGICRFVKLKSLSIEIAEKTFPELG